MKRTIFRLQRTVFSKDNRPRNHKVNLTDFRIILSPQERPKAVVQPNPPEKVKMRKEELWCPYCARPTKFERDRQVDLLRCVRCGITEHDYYVRCANHLWR